VENQPHDEVFAVSSGDEDSGSLGQDSDRSADFGDRQGLGKSADEEDFDFQNEFGASREDASPMKGRGNSKVVSNQPFDEAVELSDDGSEISGGHGGTRRSALEDSTGAGVGMGRSMEMPGRPGGDDKSEEEEEEEEDEDDEEEDEDEEEEEDDESTGGVGAYNPDDFAHLDVSGEVKELFQYITRYKPQTVELETKLKPFIPDYIPAVGEIDAFLKIPRPDGKEDNLGLVMLDEPAAVQTDPAVLDMQIREFHPKSHLQPAMVATVENPTQNPKKIQDWISSINQLHRKRPPPTVKYTKNFPDIQLLMQVWPQEMEEILNENRFPPAELDVDVAAYIRIACAMLDIPVYSSLKESLHVLFTLYAELKDNQQVEGQDGDAGLAVTGFNPNA